MKESGTMGDVVLTIQRCMEFTEEVINDFYYYLYFTQLFKQRMNYAEKASKEHSCVCVCVDMFMRTQICIMTWVWHRYYKEKVIYEDIFSVPII